MKINLREIPEEGQQYQISKESGELGELLCDLIGDGDFHADFFIRPLNTRDYEVRGKITSQTPESCSRCGIDIEFPINETFHEILIPYQGEDRIGKYSKANHVSEGAEESIQVTEYDHGVFDAGEFLHGIVALAIPLNPCGPENEKGDCSICNRKIKGVDFGYHEEFPAEPKVRPFEALKGLKLN